MEVEGAVQGGGGGGGHLGAEAHCMSRAVVHDLLMLHSGATKGCRDCIISRPP